MSQVMIDRLNAARRYVRIQCQIRVTVEVTPEVSSDGRVRVRRLAGRLVTLGLESPCGRFRYPP